MRRRLSLALSVTADRLHGCTNWVARLLYFVFLWPLRICQQAPQTLDRLHAALVDPARRASDQLRPH